jgi:hypothetical protein
MKLTLAVLLCAATIGLGACGGSSDLTAFIVCVDSTQSTEEVRDEYMPDLISVAEAAVRKGGRLYVDACGYNATGTVKWPIREVLKPHGELDEALEKEAAAHRARELEPEFTTVLEENSPHPGTPLAKILGVIARQCAVDPGPCEAYVLTDGVWWDKLLRISDGVTESEEERYVKTFGPLLGGLNGAKVYFAGVGLGTEVGEQRLSEARRVAEALVEAGGGKVVNWDVNLGALGEEA